MKPTQRTFVAVELAPANRAAAEKLIARLQATSADVKWVEPENLHLTLKFLGEVPTREIPKVCAAVERGTDQVEPFELQIVGAGAFPRIERPRTLWLGTRGGTEAMIALHGHIEKALGKLGFRKEQRRFHPHLTIGRVRGGGAGETQLAEALAECADYDAGKLIVEEVAIVSSQLGREGPSYTILGRAKL